MPSPIARFIKRDSDGNTLGRGEFEVVEMVTLECAQQMHDQLVNFPLPDLPVLRSLNLAPLFDKACGRASGSRVGLL